MAAEPPSPTPAVEAKAEPEGDDAAEAGPSDAQSNDVIIQLRPIGNAPKLKIKKFKVTRDKPVHWIHAKVKRMLNFGDSRTLFLYVDKFVPSPDETVDNLHRVFGSGGSLSLGYCEEVAFG
eukprot:c15765_g1_i1.p4 GENE.c15765_g1_i1~~c15765_g1_i1.p4  ORF type:complete len:121 (-),score=27.24 c15765_g1_i1:265-627(-)